MLVQRLSGLAVPALGRKTIRLREDRGVMVGHANITSDDDLEAWSG